MDNCSRCEITPQPHGASRGFVAVRYGAIVEGGCAERFFVGQGISCEMMRYENRG